MKRGVVILIFLVLLLNAGLAQASSNLSANAINASNSIKTAEGIMSDMLQKGFNIASINDSISEAKQLYIVQVMEEQKNQTANYDLIIRKTSYVLQTRDKAYKANDELTILKSRLDSTKGINLTEINSIYDSAKTEFNNERYDLVLELVNNAYSKLSEAEAEASYGNAIINAVQTTFIGFFKNNWKILLLITFIAVGTLIFTWRKIKLYKIDRKIIRLGNEKKVLISLIKKAQIDYFEKKNLSETAYHIKLQKFSELIRDIDRQIPLLTEEQLKLKRDLLERIKSMKSREGEKKKYIGLKTTRDIEEAERQEREAKKIEEAKKASKRRKGFFARLMEKRQQRRLEKQKLKEKREEVNKKIEAGKRAERQKLEAAKRNEQERKVEQKKALEEFRKAKQEKENLEKLRNEEQIQKEIGELSGKRRKSIFQKIRLAYLKGKERRMHEKDKRELEHKKRREEQIKKREELRRQKELAKKEAERKKAEQRKLEEQRRAEEKRKNELIKIQRKKEEEQKRIEEQRKRDEQKRLNEQKRAEEQERRDEEKKLEEQNRRDEQKRREEQRRIKEQKRIEERKKREQQKQLEIQRRKEQKIERIRLEQRKKLEAKKLEERKKEEQKRIVIEKLRAMAEMKKKEEAKKLAERQEREAKKKRKGFFARLFSPVKRQHKEKAGIIKRKSISNKYIITYF